jgi:hypothetical protein
MVPSRLVRGNHHPKGNREISMEGKRDNENLEIRVGQLYHFPGRLPLEGLPRSMGEGRRWLIRKPTMNKK